MNRNEVLALIQLQLDTFKDDPADTDYQRGYEAALQETFDVLNEVL